MKYLARVSLIVFAVCALLFYMYGSGISWVQEKITGKQATEETAITETVLDTVESTLDLQWNIGEILDVEVENFKVQALVVDNHNGFFLVDSADLDLWICADMNLLACTPSNVNCEGVEDFISLQKMPKNYVRCMKGF